MSPVVDDFSSREDRRERPCAGQKNAVTGSLGGQGQSGRGQACLERLGKEQLVVVTSKSDVVERRHGLGTTRN